MISRQFILAETCYGELVTKFRTKYVAPPYSFLLDRQSMCHLQSCFLLNTVNFSICFPFNFLSLLVLYWPIHLSLSLIDIIKINISPQVGPILRSHRWRDTDDSVTRSMCGGVKHVNNRDKKVLFASMDYMLERRGGPRPTFDRKMKASSMIHPLHWYEFTIGILTSYLFFSI